MEIGEWIGLIRELNCFSLLKKISDVGTFNVFYVVGV